MVSGGPRPTAPQNNLGVSASGGNGSKNGIPNVTATQPAKYVAGQPWGQGRATMQNAQAAPLAGGSPEVHSLTGDTGSSGGFLSDGVDFGRGGGSDTRPANGGASTLKAENATIVDKYMPFLLTAMNTSDTPDSYKRFVNSLMGMYAQ